MEPVKKPACPPFLPFSPCSLRHPNSPNGDHWGQRQKPEAGYAQDGQQLRHSPRHRSGNNSVHDASSSCRNSYPSIVGRVYDICQSAPHLKFHVETGPAEDRLTLDGRMAKAIWNEPGWEGVLQQGVYHFRQQTVQSVGSLIRSHIIQTNHPAKSVLIAFKMISDFAALEGWVKPTRLPRA